MDHWEIYNYGIVAVYEILAGEIDVRGNALGLLGVGNRVDWRRAFAMRLWFGIPADGEIKDAVQEYWMACQQDSSIAKPVPWYSTTSLKTTTTGVYDGIFQLLKLYAGSGGKYVGRCLEYVQFLVSSDGCTDFMAFICCFVTTQRESIIC